MRPLQSIAVIITAASVSCCAGHKEVQQTLSGTSIPSADSSSAAKKDNGVPVDNNASPAPAVTAQPVMDTGKMRLALNGINDLLKGNLDTNKLKSVAAGVLSADAAMLSDSGIANLGGNSNDPAVVAAKNTLLKMRNSMGITPASLDSMKQSAATLSKKYR